MKRVLMVAYNFPPIGSVSSHRPAKFVKHLHEFGWDATVLTRRSDPLYPVDRTLLRNIPQHVRVHRIQPVEPRSFWALLRKLGLGKVGTFLSQGLSFPDDCYGWLVAAFQKASEIIEQDRPDVLWNNAVPTTAALLGLMLKRRFGLPWVLDFHNEWTRYMYYRPVTRFHHRTNLFLEETVMRTADRVVTLNPIHTQDYRQRSNDPARFVTIENGYDSDDFSFWGGAPPGGRVVFAYAGAVYGYQSPRPLIQSLVRLVERGALSPEKIEVRIAGDPFSLLELPRSLPFTFSFQRNVPHGEICRIYAESNVLFLALEEGARRQLPAKLYEYMKANRPVVALVPAGGPAAELVRRARCGVTAPVEDPDRIDRTLLHVCEAVLRGHAVCEPDGAVVRRYERRELTRLLGKVLDGVLNNGKGALAVSIRPHPYPFQAALAISNDADDYRPQDFQALHRFLSSGEITEFGRGLELPFSDSLFFYSNEQGLAYFSDEEGGRVRTMLCDAIERGWVDTLHGLGDYNRHFEFDRSLALRAAEELERLGFRLPIWSNHGSPDNRQNFLVATSGGDRTADPAYHADLLPRYGVRYVWAGDLSGVVGQDRPLSTWEFVCGAPGAKPPAKLAIMLSALLHGMGGARFFRRLHRWVCYRMNVEDLGKNELLWPARLRDGTRVFLFRRLGAWHQADGSDLWRWIGPSCLRRLLQTGGSAIVYTHLCKSRGAGELLAESRTCEALRQLAEARQKGLLWVDTASRLLDYSAVRKYLRFQCRFDERKITIRVTGMADPSGRIRLPNPSELEGVTFYIPHACDPHLFIGDRELATRRNPPDEAGRSSVTVLADVKDPHESCLAASTTPCAGHQSQ